MLPDEEKEEHQMAGEKVSKGLKSGITSSVENKEVYNKVPLTNKGEKNSEMLKESSRRVQ